MRSRWLGMRLLGRSSCIYFCRGDSFLLYDALCMNFSLFQPSLGIGGVYGGFSRVWNSSHHLISGFLSRCHAGSHCDGLLQFYNLQSQRIQRMQYDDYEGEMYDTSLDAFTTYEQYLDSHITKEDLMYLEDIQLARQLKQEGYHSKTEILTREQFYAKKKEIEEAKQNQNKDKTKSLASTVVHLKACPFLKALAERQEKVLNGRLLTIIFLRIQNPAKKVQVSGYIDYAHRLKIQDFRPIFQGKVKLMPKPTDLSYYNWKTGVCASNDSPNFKVDASSGESGLLFRNKRDRKVINVNPNLKQDGKQTIKRYEISSPDYTQIVLYDHETRKKN